MIQQSSDITDRHCAPRPSERRICESHLSILRGDGRLTLVTASKGDSPQFHRDGTDWVDTARAPTDSQLSATTPARAHSGLCGTWRHRHIFHAQCVWWCSVPGKTLIGYYDQRLLMNTMKTAIPLPKVISYLVCHHIPGQKNKAVPFGRSQTVKLDLSQFWTWRAH